jgi:hypothetical protein
MYLKLVVMSIGNGMAVRMYLGMYQFKVSGLSQTSSASSVAESNAGALFSAINFFNCIWIQDWEIYISVLFNIFTLIMVVDFYKRTPQAGLKENIFIYLGVAILNIFCFCLSKEPYQMLFFFLMAMAIIAGRSYQQKSILLGGALFLTILLSRKYYGLVFLYYFFLQYIVRYLFDNIDFQSKNGKKKLITNIFFTSIIIGFSYFFLLSYLSTSNESTYNEMMNANYRDMSRASVADSEIVPFFSKGNRLLATFDYVIKIFRLMFPVELLIKGKAKYLFFIAFQILLVFFISRAFINRRKKEEDEVMEDDDEEEEPVLENRYVQTNFIEGTNSLQDSDDVDEEGDEDEENEDEEEIEKEREEDRRQTRTAALYLYLAFLLCSAAFEPDFGSWIRHQGVALPIILLIL